MADDLHDRWHRAACAELEERVQNRTFWLWVRVEEGPSADTDPDGLEAETWEAAANEVEEWLGSLDPETIDEDDPPNHVLRPAGVQIELGATPKKPSRRGTDPLIGNLYPGLVYPRGSFTAGPAADSEGPGMGPGLA